MDPMDEPNFILIPPNGNASTRPPVEYPHFILNPPNGNASTRPPAEYPHFILPPQHENLNTHELPRPNNIPNPIQAIIPRQQPPETERNYYPCGDLLNEERRREYIDICVPLHEAAITGDWEAALRILSIRPFLVWYCINENWETPLHVAVAAQHTKFVENLVYGMEPHLLQLQNKQGNTALCLAATAGNVQVAKIMVEKNPQLLVIDSPSQNTGMPSDFPPLLYQDLKPLFFASLFGKRDMVTYLYDKSQELAGRYVTYDGWGWIILKCIEAELYDVALNMLEYHEYALSQFECVSYALQDLARKPCAFDDKKPYAILGIIKSVFSVFHVKVGPTIKESEATYVLRKIWRKVVEKPRDYIDNLLKGPKIVLEKPKDKTGDMPQEVEIEKEEAQIYPSQILSVVSYMPQEVEIEKEEVHIYPSQILSVAAEMGNTKFVVELIREYPDLIWKTNDLGQTIFHIAVSHCREGIYSLLHEIGSLKDLITTMRDIEGNNMLHLVGMNAEKNALEDVSGAAFQLQRKLLWFKEIESMIPPSYKEQKNNAGKTPRQLFTESHKDLVSLGEKWMKGTANQSMVVAALITTVVFSVAFTIPGGYDQNTGFPIFLRDGSFIAFVILDAISLILSSASILMFLSILTSRYAQNDFLESLPKKLMLGLVALFLSIVTMMVTFTISFFVLYRDKLISIPVIISAVAVIPILLYAKLQFPLLVDVYRSTYSSKLLLKPKNRKIYYRNPRF